MGKKQKDKATHTLAQPLEGAITGLEQPRTHFPLGAQLHARCQAIVEENLTSKCGTPVSSSATKWCDYHEDMRQNLHIMFHRLLAEYRASAVPLPDMAVVRETVDLEWLKMIAEPLRARIDLLGRCLLNRVCYMERMHGDDLLFGTKNAIKDLKVARSRLQNHLRTIEQRMSTLILCTYEDQNPIAGLAAQLLDRVNKVDQRCTHHGQHSGPDLSRGLAFPISRRHEQEVARKGVVDFYLDQERARLRKLLLAKLGIQMVDSNKETCIVAHWDSLVDHERAHIAAAYFRRIIWNEAHLFVLAYLHTRSFKARTINLPKTVTSAGEELDLNEDIDAALLCMITFLLSSLLQVTHLEILWGFIVWPAHLEVRTAVQDIIIEIRNFRAENSKSSRPYWAHPIKEDLIWTDDDPTGTVELLCGTLFQAAYPQATRDDTFEPRFWSHIGSFVRCGKCLFAMVYHSDQWCDMVRIFAAHRVPLYNQILPQIVGSAPGNLWSVDRVSDRVRGQRKTEVDQNNGQAPCTRYRLDELLELAGVTMLGIIEGGPVDTRSVTNASTARFMSSFILLPQPVGYDPMAKSILRELLKRSQMPDATFTFRATVPLDYTLDRVLRLAPQHNNVLQRFNPLRPDRTETDWSLSRIGLNDMRFLTRLKYEPVPRRIEYDTTLVEIAYKHTAPGSINAGIQPILDLLLDMYMTIHNTPTPDALATKLEDKLENGYKIIKRDHTGAFSFAFDPARVMPFDRDSGSDTPHEFSFGLTPAIADSDSRLSVPAPRRPEWFDLMMCETDDASA
ncbi:hypothetical protein RhiLY_11948 [Ceratobasidium sp. AG-Ba]|nr:hypothetical protein RhiLY_11948 [Ceratobasidium sp. AG-Ba]